MQQQQQGCQESQDPPDLQTLQTLKTLLSTYFYSLAGQWWPSRFSIDQNATAPSASDGAGNAPNGLKDLRLLRASVSAHRAMQPIGAG